MLKPTTVVVDTTIRSGARILRDAAVVLLLCRCCRRSCRLGLRVLVVRLLVVPVRLVVGVLVREDVLHGGQLALGDTLVVSLSSAAVRP